MSGPDRGIPVIRLTVEGMKFSIVKAITEYEAVLAEETRKAVEAYCTPENIKAVIDREVAAALTAAIREEVDRFYRRGDGRRVIQQAVKETLLVQHRAEGRR